MDKWRFISELKELFPRAGPHGNFALGEQFPGTELPVLTANPIGPISFPIDHHQGHALRTLVNTTADTDEERLFSISGPGWGPAMKKYAVRVLERMGVSGRIVLGMHAIHYHGEGRVLTQHVSEASDAFATLFVQLPAVCTGGGLTVTFGHQKFEYDFSGADSSSHVHCVGLFNDCEYNIAPVSSGHRIMLVYKVSATTTTSWVQKAAAIGSTHTKAAFQGLVNKWITPDSTHVGPDLIVLPLMYEYKPDTLSFRDLKGSDAAEVSLITACPDLNVFLCHGTRTQIRDIYDSDDGGSYYSEDAYGKPPKRRRDEVDYDEAVEEMGGEEADEEEEEEKEIIPVGSVIDLTDDTTCAPAAYKHNEAEKGKVEVEVEVEELDIDTRIFVDIPRENPDDYPVVPDKYDSRLYDDPDEAWELRRYGIPCFTDPHADDDVENDFILTPEWVTNQNKRVEMPNILTIDNSSAASSFDNVIRDAFKKRPHATEQIASSSTYKRVFHRSFAVFWPKSHTPYLHLRAGPQAAVKSLAWVSKNGWNENAIAALRSTTAIAAGKTNMFQHVFKSESSGFSTCAAMYSLLAEGVSGIPAADVDAAATAYSKLCFKEGNLRTHNEEFANALAKLSEAYPCSQVIFDLTFDYFADMNVFHSNVTLLSSPPLSTHVRADMPVSHSNVGLTCTPPLSTHVRAECIRELVLAYISCFTKSTHWQFRVDREGLAGVTRLLFHDLPGLDATWAKEHQPKFVGAMQTFIKRNVESTTYHYHECILFLPPHAATGIIEALFGALHDLPFSKLGPLACLLYDTRLTLPGKEIDRLKAQYMHILQRELTGSGHMNFKIYFLRNSESGVPLHIQTRAMQLFMEHCIADMSWTSNASTALCYGSFLWEHGGHDLVPAAKAIFAANVDKVARFPWSDFWEKKCIFTAIKAKEPAASSILTNRIAFLKDGGSRVAATPPALTWQRQLTTPGYPTITSFLKSATREQKFENLWPTIAAARHWVSAFQTNTCNVKVTVWDQRGNVFVRITKQHDESDAHFVAAKPDLVRAVKFELPQLERLIQQTGTNTHTKAGAGTRGKGGR
jgi:hypothetical protein